MISIIMGVIFSTLMVILIAMPSTYGWWFFTSKRTSACRGRDGHPYYFGTTNLWCLKKFKRGAPDRGTWDLTHRWIYYRGYYFERLSSYESYGTTPSEYGKCSAFRESVPAGYSKLSVDCIRRCTNRYRRKYGSYNVVLNNCHNFANRLSAVLCNSITCPRWCY